MVKESEIELKVGLFVSIGLGLVMLAILMLGGAESLFTRHNRYVVHVPAAEGLISGAKVLLGGLSVGTVGEVEFDPATKDIAVAVNVQRKYADLIREDSRAEIATQGLLGDKFVTISLGSEDTARIPPDGQIPAKPSKDIAQLLGRSDQLMVSLNRIASNLDQILATFNTGNRSEAFFAGMTATARNMSQATARLNAQLEEARLGQIGKRMNSILEKIDRGQGTVGALINDPAIYDDLKSLTGGANRSRVVRNLVRKTIKEGEGAETEAKPRR
jgi:phospholipid/cholesterol/gamma-HCH transport system substrate-binding protein